jgi:protein-tyrosine phosphatase
MHEGVATGSPGTATFNILFVCTGNTCRSPLAEAIARREIERRGWGQVRVSSAGIAAREGDPVSDHALAVGRRHGLPLEAHRSRPLTGELASWADLILAMGPAHLHPLERLGAGEKSGTLGDFAAGETGAGPAVPDPYGSAEQAYEETHAALVDLVARALDRLAPIVHP